MCPTRTLHVCHEVQRTIDGHPGGGRVLPETAAGLQARAGAQHNGGGGAAVILAGPDAADRAAHLSRATDAAVCAAGAGLLMDGPPRFYISARHCFVCCWIAVIIVLCRGRCALSDLSASGRDRVVCCLRKLVYALFFNDARHCLLLRRTDSLI